MRSWNARGLCTDWKRSSRSNTRSWRRAAIFPSSRATSRRGRARTGQRRLADEFGDEIAGRGLAYRRRGRRRQPGTHHADELAERHRLREEIALPYIATDGLQLVTLVPGLDAFGDGFQSDALAQFDDGLAQAGIQLVAIAVHHIAAVDLQLAEGKLAQTRQRGIAGAEIIQR